MKIRQAGAALIHADEHSQRQRDRQTDSETDVTEHIVALRDFVDAANKKSHLKTLIRLYVWHHVATQR
jgi:hypothetical protein